MRKKESHPIRSHLTPFGGEGKEGKEGDEGLSKKKQKEGFSKGKGKAFRATPF